MIILQSKKKAIITNSKTTKNILNNKKYNNNIKYKNNIKFIIYDYFIYLFLLLIIFNFCLSNGKLLFLTKLNKLSEINITIRGNGTQSILDNANRTMHSKEKFQFNSKPSEIFVNGIKENKLDFKVYDLINEENNITIRLNYLFTFCGLMFFKANVTM